MPAVIIPLAGPDFFTPKYGIRPLYKFKGTTFFEYVISKRWWLKDADLDLIFVLRDEGDKTEVMKKFIIQMFPDASTVILSHLTQGAPLSTISGLALLKSYNTPIIVDLLDIVFECNTDPLALFDTSSNISAIIPYFTSNHPKFSYLIINGDNVLKTREKEVISNFASAGVYIFKNFESYMKCVIFCIQNPTICNVGSASFICPSVNALISKGNEVKAFSVDNVEPIGTLFHS